MVSETRRTSISIETLKNEKETNQQEQGKKQIILKSRITFNNIFEIHKVIINNNTLVL